jgi:hypothetical protein
MEAKMISSNTLVQEAYSEEVFVVAQTKKAEKVKFDDALVREIAELSAMANRVPSEKLCKALSTASGLSEQSVRNIFEGAWAAREREDSPFDPPIGPLVG